jgi:hypothetical protein
MIDWKLVQVEPKGEFQVEPLRILDWREITLRNRSVAQVKVQWKSFSPKETTWELEGDLQNIIQSYSKKGMNIEDNVLFEGGKDVTSPKINYF